jgi:two-component system cell cycle sensor histidine kinase/response regulator CckA
MIIYQGTTGYCPNKYPYRDLASASATDLQALPHSVSVLEQGGKTPEGPESAPGSQRRPRRRRAQRRRGHVPQTTILIVDDEEPVRATLAEVLGIHGYRVVTAASVGEAEEAKQRLGIEGIHLVITDIHLTPGRQIRAGYALAQRWRAQHPGLPFILMSGDPSNQELPDVRAGGMRFLLKPFQMEAFLEVVRQALGR